MATIKYWYQLAKAKSRRDGTLLTVDFNLRTENAAQLAQSPAWDDTFAVNQVSSLRDLVETWRAASLFRRLKSTVNKVLSLRDSLSQTTFLHINN